MDGNERDGIGDPRLLLPQWLEVWSRLPDWPAFRAQLQLSPGATEAQLLSTERRLGVNLPPSYRRFLAHVNGWGPLFPRGPVLLPVDDIGWLRDNDDLDIIRAYTDPNNPDRAEERAEYENLLLIGSEPYSTLRLFLSPYPVGAKGEWPAWDHAHSHPGARVYPTFSSLLLAEYDHCVWLASFED